ncbi:hypothetical protein CFIMG_002980RA [Ceratocystis fimbriata CBS 114723]|uniref:Golgi to ER traffic protein 2 n=1 Tax=Ceratocystis fimbriata CBS 114723 TaxID=1035309 RepID=A0A2C5X8G2_9PEZI|nr:hypothetical protein CFIMG_002980RA [Ceratocystis fimbriata CBS 114723]
MDSPEAEAQAAAARAAEQARIRKERRAAKILAGGSSRLNKITGLSGRKAETEPPAPADTLTVDATTSAVPPAPTAASSADATSEDPAEVDISNHFYEPTRTTRPPVSTHGPPSAAAFAAGDAPSTLSEAQLRSLMLGMDPANASGGRPSAPTANGVPAELGEGDPFAMLQQMMGGAGASAGIGGMFPGGIQPTESTPTSRSAAIFRVMHVLFALSLGIFIALKTPFTGSLSQRLDPSFDFATLSSVSSPDAATDDHHTAFAGRSPSDLLWVFATGEAVLLSARYFVEKNSPSAGVPGILGTILSFIPPPLGGYIKLAMRYGQFFMAVRNDIMLSVFVLGVCAWVKA